jgi:hypothetical protein
MNSFYEKNIIQQEHKLNETKNKLVEINTFFISKNKQIEKDKMILFDDIKKNEENKQNAIKVIENLKIKYKTKNDDKDRGILKEQKIFNNEQQRIKEKLEMNNKTYNCNIDFNNNILYYINLNNDNIKEQIKILKNNRQSSRLKKYKIRNEIENNLILNKKTSKLKQKHIILYKSKLDKIENNIEILNSKYDINNNKYKLANKKYYDIKEKINQYTIDISNIQIQINQLINTPNNEDNVIKKISVKMELEEKIETLLKIPEYNLETFYKTIELENKTILNEINILNDNKIQLEELIKYDSKISNSNLTNPNYIKEEITYKTEILKLNARLTKNTENINYLLEDNMVLAQNYNEIIKIEEYHNIKSHKRLEISKKRINNSYDLFINETDNIIKTNTKKISSLKEKIKFKNENIKSLNLLQINNKIEYEQNKIILNDNINYINKQILKFKKLKK